MPAEGVTTTGKEPDILEQASRALAAGRAREALDLCRSDAGRQAPAARSQTVQTLALSALGEAERAAETAAAVLARKDCDAPCLELLGGYYERHGNLERALECFRRASELAPGVGELWRQRAQVESRLERHEDAVASLEKALASGLESPLVLNELSTAYVRLERYGDAAAAVRRLIERQGRAEAATHLWLGKILLADEKPAEALPHFRRALMMDAGQRDSLSGLAISYGKLKQPKAARQVAAFMVKRHPMYRIESRGPAQAQILVFEQVASQMWRENRYGKQAYAMMNTIAGLPPEGLELRHIYVDHLTVEQLLEHCFACDVVFNNVCNGEMLVMHKELGKLKAAVAEAGVPIVNHPDRVINSTRENNYNHFKNDSRFVFPKTRSYLVEKEKLGRIAELIRQEFELPYILRTPTTHMGTSMALIEKDEDLPEQLAKFVGRYTYAIKYHECRFRDDIFWKFRACFIGGDFHPIRIDFKKDWNVHRFDDATQLMLEDESLRKEELAYITDARGYLGDEAMDCLETINKKLRLDFLGIDFAVGADGRLVIFEANPAMNVLEYRRMKDFPYFEAGAREVEKSFRKMLLSRADARRIAPIGLA